MDAAAVRGLRLGAQHSVAQGSGGGGVGRGHAARSPGRAVALAQCECVAGLELPSVSGVGRQLCERRPGHAGPRQSHPERQLRHQCVVDRMGCGQAKDDHQQLRAVAGGRPPVRGRDRQRHPGADSRPLRANPLYGGGRARQRGTPCPGLHRPCPRRGDGASGADVAGRSGTTDRAGQQRPLRRDQRADTNRQCQDADAAIAGATP